MLISKTDNPSQKEGLFFIGGMMKYFIFLLLLSPAFAADLTVGEVRQLARLPSNDYMQADGRCLKDKEYSRLARELHNGSFWPYGRCNKDEFRLPKLEGYVIKVK